MAEYCHNNTEGEEERYRRRRRILALAALQTPKAAEGRREVVRQLIGMATMQRTSLPSGSLQVVFLSFTHLTLRNHGAMSEMGGIG